MAKFIIGIQITFWIGFVLGDAFTGFCFQMAFVAGYALVRLVPGRVWLTIGEALADLAPWLIIASIDW
jgi:hypothetical protein